MSLIRITNSVRNSLASHYMYVEDDWINGFVEFTTENSCNNITEDELQTLAREQWLLNDLKDICPGSLPANLSQQVKTILKGKYVLQVNSAIDIGAPAYQQYLKLQKVNMENVEVTTKFEDKIPSHRMINLTLTDGVQDISAIEYRPMRNLSCDITPGCKILIKGPVECRRGIILLKESSVELLGGEVQEIIESNSLAGLLSSRLSLPMIKEADPNVTLNISRNTNVPIPHTQMPPVQSIDDFESTLHPTSRPVARVTSVQLASFNDDIIDINDLNAIEEQFVIPGKRPTTDQTFKPEKKVKVDTLNQIDDYPDELDILAEDEEYLREIEADFMGNMAEVSKRSNPEADFIGNVTEVKKPISISSEPYIFIKQINELSDSEKQGRVFIVKAQIIKLLSKLSVGKHGWSLKCTIIDGTDSLDVEFTSAVLSKLVGYTPQEMNQLKKDITSKPELKEKAISVLQKAKETLQVLYSIIELTILEVPKITNLTPFDSRHVDLLRSRLQKTGL